MKIRRAGFLVFVVAMANVLAGVHMAAPVAAAPVSAPKTCTPRLLVLSAMPLEIDPLLAHAQIDQGHVELNNRYFVLGKLEGNDVIMGLTGIGPENAQTTTTDAFNQFRCGSKSEISGVVFSGTSGGDYIGDVMVPSRWTDNGTTFAQSDPGMLAVAKQAVAGGVKLEQSTPTGDPACTCAETSGAVTPITVEHVPKVELGGTGLTTDPFGGRTLPCVPAGSDVFGCVPCRELDQSDAAQAAAFATSVVPFLELSFFTGYANATTPAGTYVSEDEETDIVAQVAASEGVPFIGFRAASDGGGDPLDLPGFPAEFFVYRQLAADNAAATAMAFLHEWAAEKGVR